MGDVVPRIALARELQARGHQVVLACVENFRALVDSYGLAWAELGAYPAEDEERPAQRRIMSDPDPGRRGELLLAELFGPMLPGILRQLAAMSAGFNLVVINDLLAAAALPGADFSPPSLAITITSQPVGGFARLVAPSPWPKVVGSHPSLLPVDHGLGPDFVVTDFWLVDEPAFQPAAEIDAFLSSGPPVIAVTMGTAWGRDPFFQENTLLEAARRADVRIVIQDRNRCAGATWRFQQDPSVLFVGELPYSWLFNRVDGVVHHGGAGTTAEALRAGRPSVVLPQYGDHLYWAHRLAAVGASAGTLLPNEVTAETLSARITRALEEDAYRGAAAAIGRSINPAQGVARACDFLESL
jgi:UDP:flavonoid glycosyltransferase YjiC (YdhE family)